MKGYALFYYENTPNGVVKKYFNSMAYQTWGSATNTTFETISDCIDVFNRYNLSKSVPVATLVRIEGPKRGVYSLTGNILK